MSIMKIQPTTLIVKRTVSTIFVQAVADIFEEEAEVPTKYCIYLKLVQMLNHCSQT